MLNKLPPPVLKYDIGDMAGLTSKIKHWSDYSELPEIELKEVWVGVDAVQRLPRAFESLGFAPGGVIVVVMDGVEYRRKGSPVKDYALSLLGEAGYAVEKKIIEGDSYGIVHAGFKEVQEVKELLGTDKAVLSIGSGAITDIAKHACFLFAQDTQPEGFGGLPLVSVMTANTVGAYTSRMSIISKDNVKRTWPSRTPDILIMDIGILMDCPRQFSVAGAGDMLPVFCAYADWYFADRLGMGSFLDASWRIVDDIKDLLLPYAGKIANGSEVGMEVAGKCLLETGLCMTYARDSAPVSGYEHVISHMLDMTASHDGRQTGIHGQQVGIASILSILNLEYLIEKLNRIASDRGSFDAGSCYPGEETMREKVFGVFHEVDPSDVMGAECWRDYSVKLMGWGDAKPKLLEFLDNWREHSSTLRELMPRGAQECVEALRALGMPLEFSALAYPVTEERGRWAFRNAMFMRKRLTAADILYYLGFADDEWERCVFTKYDELLRQAGECV